MQQLYLMDMATFWVLHNQTGRHYF